MPSIAIKIMHPTKKHLILYKEGVFWVAYEQSAYVVAQFKSYKPTKRYYKNINKSVVSVGFPKIEVLIDELVQNNSIVLLNKTTTCITAALKEDVNSTSFKLWKQNINVKENKNVVKNKELSIEALVKAFPLANKTPMEAFLFLKELQES